MRPAKIFLGLAGKLHHDTPGWVPVGAWFHIRIRSETATLIVPDVGASLVESASRYHANGRWSLGLFLVMPDHVHALVAFDNFVAMSSIIRDWKRFHTRRNQVRWQDGYFDHRLRNEREQLDQQVEYILSNPFVKGLCAQDDNWPWVINNLG